MSAADLLRLMDEAGVSKMVLQATHGPQRGTDAQAWSYARKYPERFYFHGAYRYFPERVQRFRQLLSELSEATARKLAHENAERLLKPGSLQSMCPTAAIAC